MDLHFGDKESSKLLPFRKIRLGIGLGLRCLKQADYMRTNTPFTWAVETRFLESPAETKRGTVFIPDWVLRSLGETAAKHLRSR